MIDNASALRSMIKAVKKLLYLKSAQVMCKFKQQNDKNGLYP
ncbi:hypothetical protein SNE26_05680 [Mucilaginibacter sp. cycad4]|nr:hypothetical protein [Mucilaginibacter gossypii]WPV01256.1 hypothetical protein SNE26_05680 [Mucilaginibacter gossypii]